jgi:monodehydroascorbate reductase (NADH)
VPAQVTAAILRDGRRLPADMVVVGIGGQANTELFKGQLAMEKGGIKVNGQMQTSDASVYAAGDVASFPVKLFGGDLRRLEHVDCARRTARHAVMAALDPTAAGDIDYMPFFYSRVFALSWRFYGDNAGKAVHFGDFSPSSPKFGAFWVSEGRIAGAFLEGGSPEEYDAIAHAVRSRAAVPDIAELVTQGLAFVREREGRSGLSRGSGSHGDTPSYAWHATVGVVAVLSIAAIAYWLRRRAPYLPKRNF